MSRIAIACCPLTVDRETVFSAAQLDAALAKVIQQYSLNLAHMGIETFDRYENIIITEKGYFLACWEKDLMKA